LPTSLTLSAQSQTGALDLIGERDLRARALAVGWRYDALGRLACPSCVRHDPSFRVSRLPAPASQYPRRR